MALTVSYILSHFCKAFFDRFVVGTIREGFARIRVNIALYAAQYDRDDLDTGDQMSVHLSDKINRKYLTLMV